MPNGLKLLIIKEVKDLLRDPKILIGMILFPALILPIMGGAISLSTQSSYQSASGSLSILIVDHDGGEMAAALEDFLRRSGANVTVMDGDPAEVAAGLGGGDVLVHIPANLTESMGAGIRGNLTFYINFRDYSFPEFIKSGRVNDLILSFERMLVNQTVSGAMPGSDPSVVLNPLDTGYVSMINGKPQQVDPSLLQNTIMMQSYMTPFVIMIVLILAMQVAATSIAVEKEAKTLETLLTIPVSRLSILFSKLVGSVTIALLATVATVFAFTYYMGAVTSSIVSSAPGIDLASLGIAPSFQGYLILGLSIFAALISALALALTLGTLSKDVRGAQSLIGVIIVPVFIPAIILMMTEISALPPAIQTALYLIPFTYPVLATKALFSGSFGVVLIGLVYMAAFTLLTLYVAAKVFSTDKIMTARLVLKRRQRSPPPE